MLSEISVVIPARNAAVALRRLLDSLPSGLGAVIVVDDASDPPIVGAAVRHAEAQGAAAARNAGLRCVRTPYVLFLDADTVAVSIEPLLEQFADPSVGLVAPRIRALRQDGSVIDRYEAAFSPLDMGPVGGRVRRGGPLTLVPSAAMLCRTEAIRAAGFDASLEAGEDVDLCWRLDAAGWEVRYEPAAIVLHEHRSSPARLFARRAAYGRPYARLERAYPGSFVAWSYGRDSVVDDARALGLTITTTWLPIACVAAVCSRRARWALVALLVARHGRHLRWLPLRVADDLAFAVGVWGGALEDGEWRVLGIGRQP